MEENVALKVKHLSHRYGGAWVVRDMNFEIPARGIFGLLGSNGAGKSTLMNIICGVLKQTEGKVWVHGVDMLQDPIAGKRHIGFLPQKPPLYGELTVEEYLRHAADIRYIPGERVKEAINEAMELCAITHFRKRLIRNLSGGYQQRVGIAQAIIHKPDIVVLDEPTNGLDPNQILGIRRLIQKIAEERVVLLSTHILREVSCICDQILMVDRGSLVFVGSAYDFDHYLAPKTIYLSFAQSPGVDELRKIEGVSRVEALGEGQFRVFFSDSREVIRQVLESSYKRNWRLSEMYLELSSLNDVFAELSNKER